jgi:hypothetical protein
MGGLSLTIEGNQVHTSQSMACFESLAGDAGAFILGTEGEGSIKGGHSLGLFLGGGEKPTHMVPACGAGGLGHGRLVQLQSFGGLTFGLRCSGKSHQVQGAGATFRRDRDGIAPGSVNTVDGQDQTDPQKCEGKSTAVDHYGVSWE